MFNIYNVANINKKEIDYFSNISFFLNNYLCNSNIINKNNSFSIIIISELEMKNINMEYKNNYNSTDVLAFQADDKIFTFYLGDIYICYNYINKYFKNNVYDEFLYILIHGILHLKNYRHDNIDNSRIMYDLQNIIYTNSKSMIENMKKINYNNNNYDFNN